MVDWPMPLDFPSVPLRVYRPETSIAEKLHAAVILDSANSRMKDFFDIYWLSHHQEFDSSRLRQAIEVTFQRRNTAVPTQTPRAYTKQFAESPEKRIQWEGFLRKSRLESLNLAQTTERISQFLSPILDGSVAKAKWVPESGWTKKITISSAS